MTKKKIQQLADFFYHSDNAEDVPVRLSVISGAYSGIDLSKQSFTELLTILNNSVDLATDLKDFWYKYAGQ